MKLRTILAILTLGVMVKGFWAAAVQPVLLSLGAVFTALDLEALDMEPIGLKSYWMSFSKKRVGGGKWGKGTEKEVPPIVLSDDDIISIEEDEKEEKQE